MKTSGRTRISARLPGQLDQFGARAEFGARGAGAPLEQARRSPTPGRGRVCWSQATTSAGSEMVSELGRAAELQWAAALGASPPYLSRKRDDGN